MTSSTVLRFPDRPAVRHLIRQLERRSWVSGVGWGLRRRAGVWTDDVGLSVHVRREPVAGLAQRKLQVPECVAGLDVDLLETGDPATHAIDTMDPVEARIDRHSTITVCTAGGAEGPLGLLAGHGCLPFVGGRMLRKFLADETNPYFVRIADQGSRLPAEVLAGRCGDGQRTDWAVVRLAPGAAVDARHRTTVTDPPLPLRRSPLSAREPVFQRSRVQGTLKRGSAVQLTSETLRMPDGGHDLYRSVLMVAWEPGDAFSEPGDSGSLVVDRYRQAIGAVLGGSPDDRCSYVVLFAYLAALPGALTRFQEFFQ